MEEHFETAAEQRDYQLWALHAVSHHEPATFMTVRSHVQASAHTIDPVDAEKLRAAVRELQNKGLVFIDRDDRVHVTEAE